MHERIQFSMHGCYRMCLTSQLNVHVALIRKPRGPLMCLANFYDLVTMDVWTTMRMQTGAQIKCL